MTSAADIVKARRLVHQYGRAATCWQILDPSLAHWFGADGKGVAGYATYRRVRVVAGEPVCAPERLAAVAREFEQDTVRTGERDHQHPERNGYQREPGGRFPYRGQLRDCGWGLYLHVPG